jgi:intraflagellar transport protein 122
MWSPEQKSVTKHKTSARVNSCAWTNDGHYLALGQHNGVVSVRDREGKQVWEITRGGPVWCLAWNPSREGVDTLAVGAWDGTLSFFDSAGKQRSKDKELGFDPASLGYFANGEYLVVGGSDGKVVMFTSEGVRLQSVVERPDWMWACKVRPTGNFIGWGCNDGSLGVSQVLFSTVHGLYLEKYAYRDHMTNVMVQNLITEEAVTIQLKDYVKKIAIYKDRLAVQVSDKVLIYELQGENEYVPKQQVHQAVDCNLLVVTSHHLILCQERRLQLLDFKGNQVRDWVLEAVIRYIKVAGGPTGRETLLVGLKNGGVFKVIVDNPFPVPLVNLGLSIRCLDLSKSRKMLAVVDENSDCSVFNLDTKELLFKEPNANSVAWNSEMEHMLCFSGNGLLSIKTSTFPATSQKLTGFVVGFRGSKIFCLHYVSMQTIDVPQSASMYRFIEVKDFENAYRTACLGVTDSDWRVLAMESLAAMNFTVARKAFIRNKDIRYIELLSQIEAEKKALGSNAGPGAQDLFLGDIYAYQGKFQDAARLFVKAGKVQKAIDMFSVLRQYKEAQEFARQSGVNISELLASQAEWLEEAGDFVASAQMYSAAGDHARAIKMLGDRHLHEELMELARGLPKADTKNLKACIDVFTRDAKHQHAEELIRRLGDEKSLLALHIEMKRWDDAFRMVESNPTLDASAIHLPYAYWLAEKDRFDEAQAAFARAGVPEKALGLLESLTRNAVLENRFNDAGYYFFLLATEHLKHLAAVKPGQRLTLDEEGSLQKFRSYLAKAHMYHAYAYIHAHALQPFTSTPLSTLFHIAHFLVSSMAAAANASAAATSSSSTGSLLSSSAGGGGGGGGGGGSASAGSFAGLASVPLGVSRLHTLHALAKSATSVGAYKLARGAYDRLATLRTPSGLVEPIDLAAISVKAKPFSDAPEVVPSCFRCGTTLGMVAKSSSSGGEACSVCGLSVVRSMGGFEQLALVEFVPEEGISDEMAIRLIEVEDTGKSSGGGGGGGGGGGEWRESSTSRGANVMRMDDDDDAGGYGDGLKKKGSDLFNELLSQHERGEPMAHGPVRCSREVLMGLSSNEVFIRKWPSHALRHQFFKNLIPEVSIVLCSNCNCFFNQDDLDSDNCPFCRVKL